MQLHHKKKAATATVRDRGEVIDDTKPASRDHLARSRRAAAKADALAMTGAAGGLLMILSFFDMFPIVGMRVYLSVGLLLIPLLCLFAIGLVCYVAWVAWKWRTRTSAQRRWALFCVCLPIIWFALLRGIPMRIAFTFVRSDFNSLADRYSDAARDTEGISVDHHIGLWHVDYLMCSADNDVYLITGPDLHWYNMHYRAGFARVSRPQEVRSVPGSPYGCDRVYNLGGNWYAFTSWL